MDNMGYIAQHTFNGAKFIDKGFLELVKFYLENQLENNNTIFEVEIK